jgi:carboxylesterase
MMLSAIGAVLVAGTLVAAWISRTRNRTRYETTTFAVVGSPVIPGAEPISLEGGRGGVLILHGFGDTTQSVRALAHHLHERGWTVRAPRLSGHGASLKEFTEARAHHWLSDASTALLDLQSRSTHVAIVGQSMGGALATIVASPARVDALVLLAPYMRLSRRAMWISRFHYVIALVVPYLRSRSESSIRDPDARARALGRGLTTPRLVRELSVVVRQARVATRKLRVPTLVINSPQDPRVSVSDAEAAFAEIGSQNKSLRWAKRSGHVLSVDFDRDWVASEVADWLDSHVDRA